MGRAKKTEYVGALAKPIDTGLFMPMDGIDSPQFKQYLEDDAAALNEARHAKMWALFNHFGLQLWASFDPNNPTDMARVWAAIAMNLAVAHVPGFRQPPPQHLLQRPEIVRLALSTADWQKANGRAKSDLPACLEIVQLFDQELKRSGRRALAIKRARTLRNRVSKMRQAVKAKRTRPPAIVHQFRGSTRPH